ncbi:hypothetical protein PtB15_11B43 [Puccinia triticina]|nr:hypothetical protein PtB15_11B43 [Puccinia triticina]
MSFSSLRARARAGASIRLPPYIRFAANGLLLAVLTVPGVILLGTSIQGIEKASEEIIETLVKAAPTYRAETYNYLSMFGLILEPGQRVLRGTERFAHDVRLIQVLYIVQHLLIATVIPECALQTEPVEDAPPNYQLQIMTLSKTPAQEMADQEKVRKRLIKHAFLLYLDTVLYCPPLLYMLSYKGINFFNDPTWVLIEQLGTHGHTAIIGNIILALLIKNAVYANKKSAISSLAPTENPSDLQRNKKKTRNKPDESFYA